MPFYQIGSLGLLLSPSGAFSADLSASAPSADITAAVSPSRITGTAPLAVHFSAIDTTSSISGVTDTFRQLLYTWDYGDTGAGTWSISGESKNSDVGGPLGTHVFETPGTYTVRCTASRADDWNYDEVTITVADPDTVYAGTNTVFVSPSANYSSAPSGASTVTSIPTIESNKRYMLNRGESFGAVTVPHGVSGVQVVAGGSGAKPIVSSITIGTGSLPPNSSFPSDITIENLQCTGSFTQNNSGNKILAKGLDLTVSNRWIWNSAEEYWADPSRYGTSMPYSKELFMVECTGTLNTSQFAITGHMCRSAMLGCDLKGGEQHTVRNWFAVEYFVAHNDISGPSSDAIRHSLKLHSNGDQDHDIDGTYAGSYAGVQSSRHVVVSNNIFSDTDDTNQFAVVLGPQNDAVSEGLKDMIVEDNRFRGGSGRVSDLQLAGMRMTYINNTMLIGGTAASVSAPGLHSAGLPSGWDGPYYSSRT